MVGRFALKLLLVLFSSVCLLPRNFIASVFMILILLKHAVSINFYQSKYVLAKQERIRTISVRSG
jgi:hypothetical protein